MSNSIEMHMHFSQEGNRHAMWYTTGKTTLTKKKLPRLAVVPYAMMEWLSKGGSKPNELRVWLEETMRTCVAFPKGRLGVVPRV